MMRSWTCCNGSNPLGSLSSAPALREDPGGCESADHPKIARTAEGGARSNYLFGSGFASLGEKTPSAALNWLTAIRGLTQFAVKVGLLQDDPTVGIERAKLPNTGGFHSWSEEEIAQYEAKHPIGSRARMAMALVLYTALRRGDIVSLGDTTASRRDLAGPCASL